MRGTANTWCLEAVPGHRGADARLPDAGTRFSRFSLSTIVAAIYAGGSPILGALMQGSDAGGALAGAELPQRPSIARIFDYYLGGSSHFEVDRGTAEDLTAVLPNLRGHVLAVHGFLRRAVRYLVSSGIDQFLDLGTGLSTTGDVHGAAQRADPCARVAYVDADPVTVRLAERQLHDVRGVTVTEADLRQPASVLTAPGVTSVLDFTRPVGVLAVAALPFITDDAELTGVVAAYRDACPVHSALVLSHLSPVTATPAQISAFGPVAARVGATPAWRSPEDFRCLLDGYEIVEPGLVHTTKWRPELGDAAGLPVDAGADTYSAVGQLASRESTGPLRLTLP